MSKFDFLLGYNTMLSVIKPPKIICFGSPYDEMQGDIIELKYSRISKISSEKSIIAYQYVNKEYNPYLPFIELETYGM